MPLQHVDTGERPWLRSYPAGLSWDIEIPPAPLYSLLDEAAGRYPDHRAIDFLGKHYSYAETAALVDRVVRGLRELGVRKGTRVGLLLPNCPYYPITFFAALKAGAVVAAFNPLLAGEEIARQVEDCTPRVMVTLDLKALYGKLGASLASGALAHVVVCPMADALPFGRALAFRLLHGGERAAVPDNERHVGFARLAAASGRVPHVEIDPRRDLAALLYTAGTTGEPKGIALTHFNLLANARQSARWFTGAEPGRERVLAIVPFSHALGTTAVMTFAIALGAELIMLPRFRLAQMLHVIERKRPTFFTGVPTIYKAIIDSPGVEGRDFSSLKVCVSGGDALPAEVRERFHAVTGRMLTEGYGLSECAPVVACGNPLERLDKPGSVGLPLPGTEIRVVDLDDGRTPLPAGERGEVCVAGPQVMRGYWHHGDATEDTIVDGWLHTGDVGYLDGDGFLYLVDRLKHIIKTGGYTVYPSVVERTLRQHESVAQAAAVGVPDPYRGQVVKAYVAPVTGGRIDVDNLRGFLADKLAPFEQPKTIEVRESLPVSPLGKVLKHAIHPD